MFLAERVIISMLTNFQQVYCVLK